MSCFAFLFGGVASLRVIFLLVMAVSNQCELIAQVNSPDGMAINILRVQQHVFIDKLSCCFCDRHLCTELLCPSNFLQIMNKSFNCNSWHLFLTSIIFTLALVGCGGGGSESRTAMTPDPAISSITPSTATATIPISIKVTGTNLPTTVLLSMEDATCDIATNVNSTGFNATCIASKEGSKVITIRSNADESNGHVIDRSRKINVSIAPATIRDIFPNVATINEPVTLTVTGSKIPSTVMLSMEDATCNSAMAVSSDGFSIICTPNKTGSKRITIGTNTPMNNGEVIDETRIINVSTSSTNPVNYSFGSLSISGHPNTNGFKPCLLNNIQNSILVYSCGNTASQQQTLSFSFANDMQGKAQLTLLDGASYSIYNNYYGYEFPINNRQTRKISFNNINLTLVGSSGEHSNLPKNIVVNGSLSY